MGCGSSKDAAVSSDPWELASRGQARQLERWLEMGGNPSALDRQGGRGTLLHAAAQHDQGECIRVLLRNGADVNAVTKLRGSPLHSAAMHSTGVSVRVLLDSGADPLLKNAEGKSAIDVALANGFANLAQVMRDAANRQAVKRREASAAHYSDGSAASLPRTSAPGTPAAALQAQQYRGQQGMQPRVSGAFGYPEWNATSSMAQPQPGQQRFRGLPSEMMTLATQQAAAQAQQAQPQQARVSPQPPPQPRISPQPACAAADAAPAADGVPRPSPFDQAAGQRSTPPATPPRGSPGGVTPNTSSNNLAKQPTTAEAYLAQFKEAASQGQAGSGEQRQLSAGASSGPSSNRQGSGAVQGGGGEAAAVPPHLVRNAGGVPAWWLGPQPSLGPGQSPRHARTISPPTIQEGVPLAGRAAVGNGMPAGNGPYAGEQQQQHDFNTASSSTSGGSSSLLLTDPLLNWVNTHMKQAAGAAGAPTPPPPAPERSTSIASGSSNIMSGASNMSSGLISHRSTMVDIKPWEINYDDLVIQRPIGEGSFGKVYLAKWNETLVAVKLLLSLQDIQKVAGPEAALTLSSPVLFNLQKECQLMAGMRHPNIVQFMGVSAMPPAMVTEYCGKGSLTDVLRGAVANPKQAQMLTWARRLNLALDAAKGMLYLHKRGIIHRDLKSPNLLVDSTWRVKIADFNLSKIIDVDGQNAKTGTMAGANPKWLAPEVIAGQPATIAGDVFSFGVVLWELLTWAIPWQKQSPWTVVAQVLGGKRLSIPATEQLPGSPSDNAAFAQQLPAYVELVNRCWAQDPVDRPGFDEVIRELRKFCEACVPQRTAQPA